MRHLLTISCGLILLLFAFSGCTDCENSAEERNKATVLRVHSEMEEGNIDIMDEVLADNYVRHC